MDSETQTYCDKIHWLGHDTFKITGTKLLYFDPFKIANADQKADIILITHEHFDHCSPEDVNKLIGKNTTIVGPPDCLKNFSAKMKEIKPGDKIKIGEIEIEAVPAYNVNKDFHPKKNNWVGYIVSMDGFKVYHAGDTDRIPEMKKVHTGIALLPVSGTYVMTPEEAAEAALDIDPRLAAIPMHYGSIIGQASDAEKFKEILAGKIDVVIKARSE
ncbi:MAG: MBL fold metallo-hydrolase [Candidatus Riflebacteria bacterium]|nr:MBL fold metallo-hydrolase [Candidatus Riflebacteria bacterium]